MIFCIVWHRHCLRFNYAARGHYLELLKYKIKKLLPLPWLPGRFQFFFFNWWSSCTLIYSHTCLVRVAIGDSCLCCCAPCYLCDSCWLQISSSMFPGMWITECQGPNQNLAGFENLFCWLKIKLGFLTEEIRIVTSAGRILNHASIDHNFNTYWDQLLFCQFQPVSFKFYPLESISLMIQIKISPGRNQNCDLYWHDLKSYQQKL